MTESSDQSPSEPPPAYQAPPPPAYEAPAYQPPPAPQSGYAPPYPPQPGYGQPAYPPMGMSPNDVQLWAGAAHWSAFILGFIGPLVIMLTKGTENPYVRKQAVESLNFQITGAIAEFTSAILIFVLIGIILLPIVIVFHLVFVIIASVKVSQGQDYRYPINIRMVS